VPELQVGSDFDDGRLELLDARAHHDVVLYWQAWTLQSERLNRLTAAVRRASRQLRS
jgi:LysR family transcriptional regulator (chromosome initiation inhibitor)